MKKRAIIYARISTNEEKQRNGLDIQIKRLRAHCKQCDIEIVFEYREECSGKSFNRPDYKKLQQYVMENKDTIDYILITKWDRYSREQVEAIGFINDYKTYNITVNAIEQWIDYSNPQYKLMLSMYLAIAEVERDLISMRTKEAYLELAKKGCWMARVPYGYKRFRPSKKHPSMLPKEDQASLVVEIFKEVANGYDDTGVIRKKMRKKGFTLERSAFYRLLHNVAYIGKVRVEEDGEGVIYDGLHTAIVDEELFYKVQEILNNKSGNAKKATPLNPDYPLKRHLKCPKEGCGKFLRASPSKGRTKSYHYYHCVSKCGFRVRKEVVDELFLVLLQNISMNENTIDLFREIMIGQLKLKSGDMSNKKGVLMSEIKDKSELIGSADDMLVSGEMSQETHGRVTAKYQSRIASIEIELDDVVKQTSITESDIDKAVQILKNLPELYSSAKFDDKYNMVGSIFPEGLELTKEECRTTSDNQLIGLLVKQRGNIKKKATKNGGSSHMAPLQGLEPWTL